MQLTYKQKNIWLGAPFEIYKDEHLVAAINFKSLWHSDAVIKSDQPDIALRAEGVFCPKIIVAQDGQTIGEFQFNFLRCKGHIKLISGNEYKFSTGFFMHLYSCWMSSFGTEVITYKSDLALFARRGKINFAPDAAMIDKNELELLKLLGVYFIALIDRWDKNRSC